MPRSRRYMYPGESHHVVQRGNDRQAVFVDDLDQRYYMKLLFDGAQEREVAIHAFVLMSNHVHILARPQYDRGLSRLMQDLGRRYVYYFNHRHARTGTLWEGRFRCNVVQDDAHELNCQRYIDLNPVRAKMVGDARSYRFSSARRGVGWDDWGSVVPSRSYLALGSDADARAARYGELLGKGMDPQPLRDLRRALCNGKPLGDESFLRRLGLDPAEVLRPRGRPRRSEGAPAL
jgi:putative transposase